MSAVGKFALGSAEAAIDGIGSVAAGGAIADGAGAVWAITVSSEWPMRPRRADEAWRAFCAWTI